MVAKVNVTIKLFS